MIMRLLKIPLSGSNYSGAPYFLKYPVFYYKIRGRDVISILCFKGVHWFRLLNFHILDYLCLKKADKKIKKVYIKADIIYKV